MQQSNIRVLDTGLLTAAENIAWDEAIMEARIAECVPDTIRFLQFKPSALVGYHQSIHDELRLSYCQNTGIEVNRRITGGGAIYFDEGQLGWEVIAHRSSFQGNYSMNQISAELCQAFAKALNRLGIAASFRPRNDIEVDGRKISGTGGVMDDDVIFFQGTLLIDFNMEHLLKALKIPVEKLSAKELSSASQRVVSMKELLKVLPTMDVIKDMITDALAELLGRSVEHAEPSEKERQLFAEKITEKQSIDWIDLDRNKTMPLSESIETVSKTKGGLLRLSARFNPLHKRLKQLMIHGDVLINPRRILYDLEATLKETHADDVLEKASRFLDNYPFEGVAFGKSDFMRAFGMLMDKFSYIERGFDFKDISAIETRGANLQSIVKDAKLLLVPYCAKPKSCKFRYEDRCAECGKCSVGDAYRMGREKGLKVVTINNFENFVSVLNLEKQSGSTSVIGTCCKAFFLKRHHAFVNSGLSFAILDIDNTTCYELQKEEEAYNGEFQRETQLKTEVLEKILSIKQA